MSDEHLRALQPDLKRLVRIGPVLIAGWLVLGLERFGPWRRYARLQAAVDTLIYSEIARRRDVPDLTDRTDVLSKLLAANPAMSDPEVRDHLITLLLVGHETTAATLAWTFHDLIRNPKVYARAKRAADTDDDTLRLHPAGTLTSRCVRRCLVLRPRPLDRRRAVIRGVDPTRRRGPTLPGAPPWPPSKP